MARLPGLFRHRGKSRAHLLTLRGVREGRPRILGPPAGVPKVRPAGDGAALVTELHAQDLPPEDAAAA